MNSARNHENVRTSRAFVWPIKPALSLFARPSVDSPSPFMWECDAMRDGRADDPDGGGKALWGTGVDEDPAALIVRFTGRTSTKFQGEYDASRKFPRLLSSSARHSTFDAAHQQPSFPSFKYPGILRRGRLKQTAQYLHSVANVSFLNFRKFTLVACRNLRVKSQFTGHGRQHLTTRVLQRSGLRRVGVSTSE